MADLDIASVVAQADLPAIAGSFATLKKKGNEWVCKCPFHSPDNNPSCYIFHKGGKWLFKCFSCGEAGDAIDWLKGVEGLDVPQAVKRLTGGADWKPLPFAQSQPPPKIPDRVTSKPPAGTAAPDMRIRMLGDPVRIWPYRDADGGILGYVVRYEVEGKKEIRAWTWGARGDAVPGWACGHWNPPRPIFGLDVLAAAPGRAVLIVEGEKAAEAAATLLGEFYTPIT